MEIQLSYPFNKKWKKGYLVVNPENRKNICLFNNNEDRTTISYARYLMSVHLGCEIPSYLEVDHKNDDKTDDRIENLQLLTKEQNLLKQQWYYSALIVQWYTPPCDNCNKLFYITQGEMNKRINCGTEYLFCSRSCASSFHAKRQQRTTPVDIKLIKELRQKGLSSYKISEITGASRNTIMKYW